MPCAVITAHGNVESAVRALKLGAFDFVSKPLDLGVLRRIVSTALKLSQSPDGGVSTRTGTQLIGSAPAMDRLREMILRVSRSQAPVHIYGESGTGKELVARMIHGSGPRAEGPFVPVNCGAIPSELMESEFFGHKRGSFTGAVTDKIGPDPVRRRRHAVSRRSRGPAAAHAGEAAARDPGENRAARSANSAKRRSTCASCRRPTRTSPTWWRRRNFAKTFSIASTSSSCACPPLRERAEDIPDLADAIVRRLARRLGMDAPTLTPAALDVLQNFSFPGNVRELENVLERALALCNQGRIDVGDLQLRAVPRAENAPPLSPRPSRSCAMPAASMPPRRRPPHALGDQLEDVERAAIVKALEQARYNKTAAAKALGMTFRALRYRIKKLGIE